MEKDVSLDIEFDSSMVELDLAADSAEEAIRRLTRRLESKGYVAPSFAAAVITREIDFPTGLPTKTPVAIPQTDACHCIRSSLAVGLLRTPVSFREMARPQAVLDVRLVFLLAIANPEAQVRWLQRFMSGLKDGGFLDRLSKADSAQEVVRLVRDMLGLDDGFKERKE